MYRKKNVSFNILKLMSQNGIKLMTTDHFLKPFPVSQRKQRGRVNTHRSRPIVDILRVELWNSSCYQS